MFEDWYSEWFVVLEDWEQAVRRITAARQEIIAFIFIAVFLCKNNQILRIS